VDFTDKFSKIFSGSVPRPHSG